MNDDVAVAVVVVVMEVGTAEAGGLDCYLDFGWGRGWEGACFLVGLVLVLWWLDVEFGDETNDFQFFDSV